MAFQVIRRTNEYDRRGAETNVARSFVAEFDTLGFAFANATQRNKFRVLTDRFGEVFEVRDTAGNEFGFSDVWRDMLPKDRFDEIWNADIDTDVRWSASSHVYVENLH